MESSSLRAEATIKG